MKKFFIQLGIIIGLSLVVGLVFNQFTQAPLPVLESYDPHQAVISQHSHDVKKEKLHFQEVDAELVSSFMEAGSARLLDARTAEEFQLGCIPGAISLPIATFSETYQKVADLLEKNGTIVIYCSGHDCTDSTMLAIELFKKGFKDIFIYKGGMSEWEELGKRIDIPGNVADNESETDAGNTGNNYSGGMH